MTTRRKLVVGNWKMHGSHAANAELPGVVKAFDDDQVTIDFNHPLAGKTLTFEVEILEVKAL